MPSTACLFGFLLTYFLASPVAYAGTAPLTSPHAPYNTLASLTTHAHCVEPAATKITTRLITPIIGTAGSTRALYPPYTLACTTTQHVTTCYPTKYPPGHLSIQRGSSSKKLLTKKMETTLAC